MNHRKQDLRKCNGEEILNHRKQDPRKCNREDNGIRTFCVRLIPYEFPVVLAVAVAVEALAVAVEALAVAATKRTRSAS